MQETDWSNVKVPEPEPPPRPPSILARLAAAIVSIAALAAGAVFLTVVVLGSRVKEQAIDACADNTSCVLEVRDAHDDCFSQHMVVRAPQSVADFQTGQGDDTFGFAALDHGAYVACIDATR